MVRYCPLHIPINIHFRLAGGQSTPNPYHDRSRGVFKTTPLLGLLAREEDSSRSIVGRDPQAPLRRENRYRKRITSSSPFLRLLFRHITSIYYSVLNPLQLSGISPPISRPAPLAQLRPTASVFLLHPPKITPLSPRFLPGSPPLHYLYILYSQIPSQQSHRGCGLVV